MIRRMYGGSREESEVDVEARCRSIFQFQEAKRQWCCLERSFVAVKMGHHTEQVSSFARSRLGFRASIHEYFLAIPPRGKNAQWNGSGWRKPAGFETRRPRLAVFSYWALLDPSATSRGCRLKWGCCTAKLHARQQNIPHAIA